MNLTELIRHPERMDRETLYDLRSIIALHPYYQTARLLMLQNLYLLHDATFDEELRRAAIYITDRKVLFNLIEAAHYKLRPLTAEQKAQMAEKRDEQKGSKASGSRTSELIDSFLGSLPEEEEEKKEKGRKPTPADAAVDYVAYLLETSVDADEEEAVPQMKGQSLIDDFIHKEGGRIILPELPDDDMQQQSDNADNGSATSASASLKASSSSADAAEQKSADNTPSEAIYTETMAQIYVRQGRYLQALEIIKRLNLDNPKKNAYFADQIRFLEKLVVNNNKKNK